MTEVLLSADTASENSLRRELQLAAKAGKTSTVETLLGALTERFPSATPSKHAIAAIQTALAARQWQTVVYLARYLEDTAPVRHKGGSVKPHEDSITDYMDQEIVNCLNRHMATSPGTFHLTDEVEENCVRQGVAFSGDVASVLGAGIYPRVVKFDPEFSGVDETPSEGYVSLANLSESLKYLRGKSDPVVPATMTIRLSTPPEFAGDYPLKSSGTRKSLARAVGALYQDLYDKAFDGPGGKGPAHDLTELTLVQVRHTPRNDENGPPLYSADVVDNLSDF